MSHRIGRNGAQCFKKNTTLVRAANRRYLSLLEVNVCGLKGKLLSIEFIEECKTYDVIYMSIDYTILDWTLEIGPFASTSYCRFLEK